jgi:glycosyltransferase involved in cell wall biosynthesis
VYNTPQQWLREALDSVLSQWSPCWELICVDDCSTDPVVQEILTEYKEKDKRIIVLSTPENSGIAAATNWGIRTATGQHVAFMDHDDWLEPDAVHSLLMATKQSDATLIYSDENIDVG